MHFNLPPYLQTTSKIQKMDKKTSSTNPTIFFENISNNASPAIVFGAGGVAGDTGVGAEDPPVEGVGAAFC